MDFSVGRSRRIIPKHCKYMYGPCRFPFRSESTQGAVLFALLPFRFDFPYGGVDPEYCLRVTNNDFIRKCWLAKEIPGSVGPTFRVLTKKHTRIVHAHGSKVRGTSAEIFFFTIDRFDTPPPLSFINHVYASGYWACLLGRGSLRTN